MPHPKSDIPCPQTQMPLLLSLLLQVCRMLLNFEYFFSSSSAGQLEKVTVYHLSSSRNQRLTTGDIEKFYPCTQSWASFILPCSSQPLCFGLFLGLPTGSVLIGFCTFCLLHLSYISTKFQVTDIYHEDLYDAIH